MQPGLTFCFNYLCIYFASVDFVILHVILTTLKILT